MKRFSSLRVRLVGMVFVVIAPVFAWLANHRHEGDWPSFLIGLGALAAAWLGGEFFILRQVRTITVATRKLATGDLSSRTGLTDERSELGDLARSVDQMAATLQQQILDREKSEQSLLDRAHQQTVVAALGQFALVTSDLPALLNQVAMLVAQTLQFEYCAIFEPNPNGRTLLLRAGIGWKDGVVGRASVPAGDGSQAGYTIATGEPVVVPDLNLENRFPATALFMEHRIVSSATVVIQGHQKPFGVLGVHTAQKCDISEDQVHFLLAIATMLAMSIERQRTEPEIQKLAAFTEFNPNPVLEFTSEGKLSFFNDAASKMASMLGEKHPNAVLPPNAAGIVQTCLATGQPRLQLETRPGSRILSWSFYPIMTSHVVHCYVEDITERVNLEEQFRQVQKMESVGQLAAGVAHDFNNILTIIQGHSGLLISRANLAPAMTTSIQAISFAAERAASLTRQLLMFSRKQVVETRSLDLNEVVNNMSKMLQRLIGETVTLQCRLPSHLPHVLGDVGMMEQVLMNLAVNARDAMPRGGELIINTEAVPVSEAYVRAHTGSRTGNFVCLNVKDTGCGMDAATMKRIFEPFFTTKPAGKGTGLGLATVYGIVKQHSGWIEVQSQPGDGTTFKIYFPASKRQQEEEKTEPAAPVAQVRGGGETILVVEDEPVLRDLAQLILQDCGYCVLGAASGVEALTVWQENHGGIDLLLTDMIMPDGLSGKDLAESLLDAKPTLKVIFTSGYNVDDLGTDFIKKNASHFLQKPYTRVTLAKAVRDCLDS